MAKRNAGSLQHYRLLQAILAAVVGLHAADAAAQAGNGSLRFEYQYVRTGAFDSSFGDIDIGNTDSHILLFAGDYSITDRWTVMASLPWIRKRHVGALPHNATVDFTNFSPPDLRVVDDGEYHSDFEDLYVGVQYLAVDGPVTVAPFISYGVPTNDYPFYGHAAVGRNLWHVPVGVAISWQPYFSDFYLSGEVAYVFTEKSLGIDTSHWLIDARVSYFVTPRFAPKLFVAIKHGTQGLSFPDDFDVSNLDNELWFLHDRVIKHNFTNAGIGFDWSIGDKYRLSATLYKMVRPDQVNEIDGAGSIALTRSFSGGAN